MALNLYIDQQPFSTVIYPQLCRVFNGSKEPLSANDEQEKLIGELEGMELERKVFEGLLQASLEYVKVRSTKINNQLTIYEKKQIKKEREKEKKDSGEFNLTLSPAKEPSKMELSPAADNDSIAKDFRFKNYLNNMLLFDILNIISKLVSFNLFQMIHQEEHFLTLFPNLISLLEFDFSNPLISIAVVNKREKLFKELLDEEKRKQNIMATGLSGIKNLFSDVVENVTGLTKEMAGTILGQTGASKSKGKKSNPFMDRYNENLLYSHPLMRSCLSQRNRLAHLSGEEETKMIKVEKDLKILIIDVMKQFLAMRHDFLLTNFIAWYQEISRKNANSVTEEKIKSEINENFTSVIPEILKLGIAALDLKYQIKEDGNMLNNIGGNLKSLVGNIGNLISQEEDDQSRYALKKYMVYTKEKEVKDLDGLLTGNVGGNISKTLFPSLVMMFYSTQDPHLESKFLEIIMLCFHQRLKFSESLNNLELLFDKADVDNYVNLQKTVREMRSICEKSEIWIAEWLSSGKIQSELYELKKIINFMIAAFHSKMVENALEDERPGQSDDLENEEFLHINPVRQKIACFLEIHTILIDFLKDTIHLMDKILKDRRIELDDKWQFLKLYRRVFVFLRFFVKNNTNNQEILHVYLDRFLFHMELDLGQAELICEIFKNNLSLCEAIKPEILSQFISYIISFGRRERFLNLFEIVQITNNQPLFESQAKVINALLGFTQTEKNDDDSMLHVLYMKYDGGSKEPTLMFDFAIKPLEHYLAYNKNNHLFALQLDEQLYCEKPWDEPFRYHSKLLKVLALTNQGIQGSTLSNARLRKQFDLSMIFSTLVSEDTLTSSPKKKKRPMSPKQDLLILNYKKAIGDDHSSNPKSELAPIKKRSSRAARGFNNLDISDLKPALVHYLNAVYLPIKKGKDDFQRISDNVYWFLRKELDRLREAPKEELTSEPYREYFFTGVIRFLQDYVATIVTQAINENLEPKDNEILFEIAETLENRLEDLENGLLSEQVEDLKKFMLHYFALNDELNDKLNKCFEEDERKNPKGVSQSNVSINTEIFDEGLDNSISWRGFMKLCLRSEILKKEIEKEKKALCESFLKIHLIFDEEDKKKYNINIGVKDILQKLLSFIENALEQKEEKARREEKETIMFTLEIIM